MIHFAKTSTDQAINQKARLIRVLTAFMVVVMVTLQLFTYETFVDVFRWAGNWNILVTATIVILEVAALPYLLSMSLSRLARLVSKIAGWMVVLVWGIIFVTTPRGEPTGFLGTAIMLPGFMVGGLILLLFVMMLVSVMYKGQR